MAKAENLQKKWYVIDGSKYILGRLAVDIANILMGKHRPWYTPHIDTGDFVVVTNVEKIKVTGRKMDQEVYYTWSYYPGGIRKHKMREWREEHPERLLYYAVKCMVPKSPLGRKMLKKLKIYAGHSHPHHAQNPVEWNRSQKVTLREVTL